MTNTIDIDSFLARLNPKTAESFRKASEIKTEYLPTPSLGINMAIEGLRFGSFVTLYGNRGCGKTMFALQCAANAQKLGKTVAWLDVEKNFSPEWARSLGVDPDLMVVDSSTISIAGMADKGRDLLLAGADLLVIDSISQLLPQSYFEDAKEDSSEIKSLGQTGQIGTFSKNMGQAINILNAVNHNAIIIVISQVRNQIGSYGASISFMGGKALEHANSTTIKLWRTPSDAISQEIAYGDILVKKNVGSPITWTIEKNRGSGMGDSNTYDIYNGGNTRGIDLTGEVVTYGVEYGIIKKGGAWLTIPKELIGTEADERFQGRPKLIGFLKDNPQVQDIIYGEILGKSIQ